MDDQRTSDFHRLGYAAVEDLLLPSQVAMASTAMDLSWRDGNYTCSTKADNVYNEYSPILAELFLESCRASIEAVVGRDLLRSFAYWRIHEPGADLKAHVDRPSCEVSASIAILSEPRDEIWPFWLTDLDGNDLSFDLKPGSAVVLKGHECTHWRDTLEKGRQKQLFLFYVYKGGAFEEYAYDERGYDPITGNRG